MEEFHVLDLSPKKRPAAILLDEFHGLRVETRATLVLGHLLFYITWVYHLDEPRRCETYGEWITEDEAQREHSKLVGELKSKAERALEAARVEREGGSPLLAPGIL